LVTGQHGIQSHRQSGRAWQKEKQISFEKNTSIPKKTHQEAIPPKNGRDLDYQRAQIRKDVVASDAGDLHFQAI
jgi:hypothetical protein